MPGPDEARLTLQRAGAHAIAFLDALADAPAGAQASLPDLRARLRFDLAEAGTAPAQVIDDLVAATAGGHHASAGGRFFGWVIGGALPAALAADWLASTWDENATLYACAPAACVTEEIAGALLKDIFELPASASFAFTTGCQMAHFTCLAAARHGLLARRGWDAEKDGLWGAPPIRVLANDQRHGSIDRALRFLGFGTNALSLLPAGGDGRVAPEDLARALESPAQPTILVLNAADLHLGACDRFAELIPIAHAAKAWVHVDGAFGLWLKASPAHRRLVTGIELADSWASDAHKWLNTPKDCGLAFVRDAASHRAAMTLNADYLVAGGEARDPIDWTPEWTRRARGYAVYAALRELGRGGIAAMIAQCCDHTAALAQGIGAMDGAELVAAPVSNQALVRFPEPQRGATDADHDRRNDAIIAAINATGEAFFSGTVWRGRRAMRISVVNWRTNERDVERTLAAVRRVLAERTG